jgi:hypothetical protein
MPVQVEQVVLIMEATGVLQQVTEPEEEEAQGMLLLQAQVMVVMAVILMQARQVRGHCLVAQVVQAGQVMDPEMPVMHRAVVAVVAVSLYLMAQNPGEPVLQERW